MAGEYPYDLELEQHALGEVIKGGLDSTNYLQYLSLDLFHDKRNQVIIKAIEIVNARDGYVDMVRLLGELDRTGARETAGGLSYLNQLEFHAVGGRHTPMSVVEHLDDFRLKRFALRLRARPIAATGAEEYELLLKELAEAQRFRIAPAEHISTVLETTLKELDQGHVHEVNLGLRPFDRHVGARRGDLMLVGARTSVGKTVVGVNFCRGVTERGGGAFLHSFEMSASRILKRLLAHYTEIENWKVQRGRINQFEKDHLARAAKELMDRNLWIRYAQANWNQHLAAYEAMIRMHPEIEVIVVDYLGLIHDIPGDTERHLQLGRVTRDLKALAGRLNILVIGLAQFNRKTLEQERPTLESFRESGNLEQDCDIAVLLHAPEWQYNKTNNINAPERLVMDIAKHRDGNTGMIEVYYDRRYCRIMEMPGDSQSNPPEVEAPDNDYEEDQASLL